MKWSKDISLFSFRSFTPLYCYSLNSYTTPFTIYVCGILGGEYFKRQNQEKIKPFSEGHVAKVNNHEVIVGFGMPDLSAGMRRFFY